MRQTALYGEVEPSDRLADLPHEACPGCDSSFASVTLGLNELAFADSVDMAALATYCQDVTAGGGRASIRTARPALRRLLLSSPLSGFVAAEGGDEPGPGEPYTCPHRP